MFFQVPFFVCVYSNSNTLKTLKHFSNTDTISAGLLWCFHAYFIIYITTDYGLIFLHNNNIYKARGTLDKIIVSSKGLLWVFCTEFDSLFFY